MVGPLVEVGCFEKIRDGTVETAGRARGTPAQDEPATAEPTLPSDRIIQGVVRRRVKPTLKSGDEFSTRNIVVLGHSSCSFQKRVPWSPSGGPVRTGTGEFEVAGEFVDGGGEVFGAGVPGVGVEVVGQPVVDGRFAASAGSDECGVCGGDVDRAVAGVGVADGLVDHGDGGAVSRVWWACQVWKLQPVVGRSAASGIGVPW